MAIFNRVVNLFRRSHVDREIDAELQAHVILRTDDNLASGMSPAEARRDALVRFGNPTSTRERVAAADAALSLESIWADLRYALRQLRRSPGFTAVALFTLALGIGANTAIFSLIDAALLKMLPVQAPEQLVELTSVSPTVGLNDAFSYPTLQLLREGNRCFSGLLAFRKLHDINIEVDGHGGLANGQLVSGSYFTVLGVNALIGRTILPQDEGVPGQNPVAVIGYDYWRERFSLDPAVVGKKILLNNVAFTVIGVTPPEFYGMQPGERIDISVPLTTVTLVRPDFADAGSPYDTLRAPFRNWLYVMGRLQPGVTREHALANLQPLFAQSMRDAAAGLTGLPFDSPAVRHTFLNTRLQMEPAGQGLAALRQQFSKPLWVVMAVVGLLLLVTCANVANLLLARASARQKEIAVRLAMGARRQRLMRQLMTESILLAACGGVLGLGLAFWGSRSLLALLAHGHSPVSLSVHPDSSVLAFTLGVSLFTALLFGVIPAWRASRLDPAPGLAQNARGTTNAGGRSRLAKSLVIVQVAISLVLVVGAGLLVRSLANLKDFYPGFNKDSVLLFSLNPMMTGYKNDQPVVFFERLLDRLRAIPGVRSASLSVHGPLSPNFSFTSVNVQGYVSRPGEELQPVGIEVVGPNYFSTMQTPVLRGRELEAADRLGAPKVAVVNQSMARRYFGDENPIGRQISIPGYRGDPTWLQVIGLVASVKVHDLREQDIPIIYLPLFQAPESGVTFEVRTAMNPTFAQTAVLDAVKAIDSRLPVFQMKSLIDQLDDSLLDERLVASLSGMFGVLAMLLSCVGLYGLMAYTVNRRTTEIGVRMALGAGRAQIVRLIVRETLLLVFAGLAVGIPVAIGASRLLVSELYGLRPGDPATVLAACAFMTAVALLAGYIPARRAANLNPMHALRSE
jgi:predicted permease